MDGLRTVFGGSFWGIKMTRQKINRRIIPRATDYLSRVDLDITEKDLTSKPFVKKVLVELKDVMADNLALSDSLEAAQDALEIKSEEYSQLHEAHAILEAKSKPKKGLQIIKDLALVGLGTGTGLLVSYPLVGVGCILLSGALYAITTHYTD
jgi:hypothetical protein